MGYEYCQYCKGLGSKPSSWLRSDIPIDLRQSEMITGDAAYIIYLAFLEFLLVFFLSPFTFFFVSGY